MREEWETAMLSMEQRECQLRVEMDEWKEALEKEKNESEKLRDELRIQDKEVKQQSALLTDRQSEIFKSDLPPLVTAQPTCITIPHLAHDLLLLFVCYLYQSPATVDRLTTRDADYQR